MSLQDLIILNEKVEELEELVEKQAKIIAKLKESNEFYANPEHWYIEENYDLSNIITDDLEDGDFLMFDWELDRYNDVGGKLAREIKKQVEELENEQ